MTQPIPEGFHSVTPSLILNGAANAIELYKKAFNAEELYRMETPHTAKIMHACIKIGNSMLFISDVAPEMGCGELMLSDTARRRILFTTHPDMLHFHLEIRMLNAMLLCDSMGLFEE